MKMTPPSRALQLTRRQALASLAFTAAAAATHKIFAQNRVSGFGIEGDHFVLKGKPVQVLSGEMHYARVPRAYWATRMKMIRAMGLNTLATYVFWNVHEPKPGVYDFTDNNDLVTFIKVAESEGLHVLLRAGPYSCAEWEFGGFPAWLLADPKMNTALRTNDPAFMQPVERWMRRLAQEVGSLQIENGGPIIATQIENEYGNFSNDHAYMNHLRDIFVAAGFNKSLLYTVDPSRGLAAGEIDGIFSGVNFGTGHAETALNTLAQQRPGQPLFATEYWPGWFDLWGHPHETRPIDPQLADLDNILSRGSSLNLYMVHGGTSFGMMAGASQSTGSYRGNVTSYDYDAPIDEAGHPTKKFKAYRDLILSHTNERALPVPETPPVIAIPEFTLSNSATLWDHLPAPIASEQTQTMEQLGQSYGYILYRKQLTSPIRGGRLQMDGMQDFASIYINGRFVGALDRHFNEDVINLVASGPPPRIDILVENTGRLNSTKYMRNERKGIRGAILDGTPLKDWQIYSLPMQTPPAIGTKHLTPDTVPVPHFASGSFVLATVGDTFLDVRSLGKGLLWINGRCLGRFWNIGPQGTLYLPAPWLKKGRNDVVIFDFVSKATTHKLSGLTKPILDVTPPAYEADIKNQSDGPSTTVNTGKPSTPQE